MIIIQGYIAPTCTSFNISLLVSNNNVQEKSDVALCITICFTEPSCIKRNSFLQGNWGIEEKEGPTFPLKRGHTFECIILVQEDHFKMAFNQQHYAEYRHRIQKEAVTNLYIDGDINIQTICFQGPGIPARPVNQITVPSSSSVTVMQHQSHPVINPPVPFVIPIVPVATDQTICLRGHVKTGGSRFRIRLQLDVSLTGDAALETVVNMTDEIVSRADVQHGQRQMEETTGPPLTVRPGQPFEHMILIQEDSIRLAFNGSHFANYRHRISKSSITHFSVDGDILVQSVFFQGPGIPVPNTLTQRSPGVNSPTMSFPVPYKCPIPGGEFHGRMIYICGVPDVRAKQFVVNLRCGESGTSDVAFHFNPRFAENTVVRNTHTSGAWGNMEREHNTFPFSPGVPFDMIVLCENEQFKVAVNNQHFIEYKHRLPNLKQINCLEVAGDVKLTRVQL